MASFVKEDDQHQHQHQNLHLILPEELSIEILIRLPVESLLRFKCVCKRWYALIKNPNFTRKHLHFQKTTSQNNNGGRLLIQHHDFEAKLTSYSLFPDETLSSVTYHDLDHYFQPYFQMHMEGPVNGLFCLYNDVNRIILWNPALREFRFLPLPPWPPNVPRHFDVSYGLNAIGFGLGRDSDDDYRVVLILIFNGEPSYSDAYVMVYTLRTNTWRHLHALDFEQNGYTVSNSMSSTYLNGVYYWLTSKIMVLAFDMGKEVLREISLGPDITPDISCFDILTLYNGHLALHVLKNPTETGTEIYQQWIEIWVMEEEANWIKQFSVAPPVAVALQIGFWKNGQLLFVTNTSPPVSDYYPTSAGGQLVLYNPSTQEIRDLGPNATMYEFFAVIYYESLVSVKKGKYQRNGKLSAIFSTRPPFPYRL